jgi:hypothetical protein
MTPDRHVWEQYREHAEECLRQSEATGDETAKDKWLKFAHSWQALADGAEKTFRG